MPQKAEDNIMTAKKTAYKKSLLNMAKIYKKAVENAIISETYRDEPLIIVEIKSDINKDIKEEIINQMFEIIEGYKNNRLNNVGKGLLYLKKYVIGEDGSNGNIPEKLLSKEFTDFLLDDDIFEWAEKLADKEIEDNDKEIGELVTKKLNNFLMSENGIFSQGSSNDSE